MNAKKAKGLRRAVRMGSGQSPRVGDYLQHKVTGNVIVNPNTPKGRYRAYKRIFV